MERITEATGVEETRETRETRRTRRTRRTREGYALCTIRDSLLPTPYSLLPTPYSPLPTPYSPLPTPYSPLPTPNSPMKFSLTANATQARQTKQRFTRPDEKLSYELGKAVQELPAPYTRFLAGAISFVVFG